MESMAGQGKRAVRRKSTWDRGRARRPHPPPPLYVTFNFTIEEIGAAFAREKLAGLHIRVTVISQRSALDALSLSLSFVLSRLEKGGEGVFNPARFVV